MAVRPILSILERLIAWKAASLAGERFQYHRGFLPDDLAGFDKDRWDTQEVNNAVIDCYLTGCFDLVQRRHGDRDYSYFIVKLATRDWVQRRWVVGTDKELIRGFGKRGDKDKRAA